MNPDFSLKRFARDQLPVTPWKNGGGSTRELACWPPSAGAGADMDNFGWRVSVATIAVPGPFSAFPGVDRQIMLLQGDGVHLRGQGWQHTLGERWQPFTFSGDEPVDVQQYRDSHAAFPHESTGDQFFAEDQFESYRKLGHHIAGVTFRGTSDCANVTAMARRLADIWVAESEAAGKFVTQTEALVALWERMRATPGLTALLQELHGTPLGSTASSPRTPDDEQVICLELLQLMENTFLELRLDEHWTHPDNRGWVELFSLWARSATLRAVWNSSRSTYGIRFEHFCRQRLGL